MHQLLFHLFNLISLAKVYLVTTLCLSVSLTQTQVNHPHGPTELLSPVLCQTLKSVSLVSGLVLSHGIKSLIKLNQMRK